MERFIPMVDDPPLRGQLSQAIDGKGAFRRFKDVLIAFTTERERWFAFRSERLRVFMEAWLNANALRPVPRPTWTPEAEPARPAAAPISQEALGGRRGRTLETLRKHLEEVTEALGARDLEKVLTFAEFVRARRASRSFPRQEGAAQDEVAEKPTAEDAADYEPPSSQQRTASRGG
jgi:hypothetical protein